MARSRRRQRPGSPDSSDPTPPAATPGGPDGRGKGRVSPWVWAGLCLALGLTLVLIWPRGNVSTSGRSAPSISSTSAVSVSAAANAPAAGPVIEPEAGAFAKYAGSDTCRACHTNAFTRWAASHHSLAERSPTGALDQVAFEPSRTFTHGSQSTTVRSGPAGFEVETPGPGGTNASFRVDRVIGHHPLRQYLIPEEGGRWQTLEASWDPRTNDWFNVYGSEDRQPGEWGHWTGRGMNWNSMCATCHNTRFRKNYEPGSDVFHSSMAERSVGCEACHGPMRDHVSWQQAWEGSGKKDPTLRKWTPSVHMETCAPCHARRSELTGDVVAGASFWDHYLLAIVDGSDTFYPDGQVREEDYEYSAFLGSRMHAAGVTCLDCHDPHAGRTKFEGDALCLQCHDGRRQGSPVIDPAKHTFHAAASTGSRCVNCHMPQTVYMQRHSRHDHGFTSPDPLLTRETGIPNACNRCHADKTVDWAVEATDRWYGARMERPARRRARVLAQGRRGDEGAVPGLLEILGIPETPYWKAAAVALLEPWSDRPAVTKALLDASSHEHPLVRYRALQALGPAAEAGEPRALAVARARLEDNARSVRFAAAWSLRREVSPESRAGRELGHMILLNSDQPTGQAQWAALELARGRAEEAARHLGTAVGWDGGSAGLRQDYATTLSLLGRSRQALEQVREAARLEPKVAEHHYRLGLAWNEAGDMRQTVASLEEAVRLDGRHDRALYNLALAYSAANRGEAAVDLLRRAETVNTADPRIPYARATILAQAGRMAEAREAAEAALARRPGFPPAVELLGQLAR